MTRREWSAAIVSLFREGDECIFPLIIRAIDKELASTCTFPQYLSSLSAFLFTPYSCWTLRDHLTCLPAASEELLWREETLVVDLVGEFVRTTSAQPLALLAPSVREVAKEYVTHFRKWPPLVLLILSRYPLRGFGLTPPHPLVTTNHLLVHATGRVKKKEDLADRWLVASAETMFKAVLDGIEDSPRWPGPLHFSALLPSICL
jgi:hypothetical protein